MNIDPSIAIARSRRDEAKARMLATLDETKNRLSPSTVAEHAVDGIRDKASALTTKGVAVARERPAAAAAAGGALVLFLLRKPLFGWIRRPKRDSSQADAQKRSQKAAGSTRPSIDTAPKSEPAAVTRAAAL